MAKILTDIVGHASQLAQLRSDIASENIAHAYLFSGTAHLGKTTIAKRFAYDILAQDSEDTDAVESSMSNLTHPDYICVDQLWIEGVCEDWDTIAESSNVQQLHRSKAPKAKTNTISIDDVRSLQERLIETRMGKHRVCMITSLERMQDAAANAFLKILEEPPEGLVFVITTERMSTLLPTLVSRCRTVSFQQVRHAELLKLLSGASEDDQKFITHIARGCPGLTVSLRDDPDLLRAHRTMHATAQSFWRSSSLRERLQILGPIAKRGKEADDMLLHLGLTLREQSSASISQCSRPYNTLIRDLQSNAHRQLLCQRFALQCAA